MIIRSVMRYSTEIRALPDAFYAIFWLDWSYKVVRLDRSGDCAILLCICHLDVLFILLPVSFRGLCATFRRSENLGHCRPSWKLVTRSRPLGEVCPFTHRSIPVLSRSSLRFDRLEISAAPFTRYRAFESIETRSRSQPIEGPGWKKVFSITRACLSREGLHGRKKHRNRLKYTISCRAAKNTVG